MKKAVWFALLSFGFLLSMAQALTFEERVEAQRAIERVYYNHRIWPKENPQPKPPFEQMVPEEAIRQKVELYLRESNALEVYWKRPLTGEQLQGKLNQLYASSKSPEVLSELSSTLHNDPYLIAECLVRPLAADTLIHSWYSDDDESLTDWLSAERFKPTADLDVPSFDYVIPDRARLISGTFKPDTWISDSFAPLPGADSRAVWTGSEMIVWGANGGGRYSPSTDSWQPMSSTNAPPRVGNPSVVWTGSVVIVWGASEGAGASYDPSSDSWNPITQNNAPSARYGQATVWTGSEMIVWGGSSSNTGYRFNPTLGTWSQMSIAGAPTGRSDHTAVWTGNELIVWGGYGCVDLGCTSYDFLATGGRWNPSNTWTPTAAVPGSARQYHSAVWTGNRMIVFGGNNGAPVQLFSGWSYNPQADNWASISNGPSLARHTAVWTGTQMIVWGGQGSGGVPSYFGARYDPLTDTWTDLPTVGAPAARYSHSAVWTGQEMIIWGGGLDTGGRYSPSLDSWVPTAHGRGPSLRTRATAVWTGNEMIVWGGFGGSSSSTGGMYNPATDHWTDMLGVPPAYRSYHTAIWTGSVMVVWGGGNDLFWGLDTGGRFNPGTNSWSATTTTGTPSGRQRHVASWSGIEMIIWGGMDNGFNYVNTGGRYNPTTDQWNPVAMSTGAGCPSGRIDATAVWNGTGMTVWGGIPDSGVIPLNDGAIYSSSSNTWTSLPSLNAPTGRSSHTAIWTGSSMIVWGGFGCVDQACTSSANLNTGAIYSGGTWTALPTANAPTPRVDHTAVWTGTEMVVWGGSSGIPGLEQPINTGGRYSNGVWTSLPDSGAPLPATGHVAVWTGSEMVIWGDTVSLSQFVPNTAPVSSPVILNAGNQIVLGPPADTLMLNQNLLGLVPVAFHDDVEGSPQWTCSPACPDTQWHTVFAQNCSGISDFYSPVSAWYFGRSATCDYDGVAGTYTLTSINSAPVDSRSLLQFRYILNTGPVDTHVNATATDTPVYVPDYTPVGSYIPISQSGIITDVNVHVNITHTWDGDIEFALIGPDFTSATLSFHHGGPGQNYTNTTFDDQASTPISAAAAPYNGYFIPDSPLSVFNGTNLAGTWQLYAYDWLGGFTGTIDSFSLIFTVTGSHGEVAKVEVSTNGVLWVTVAKDVANWTSADGVPLENSSTAWRAASIPLGAYAGSNLWTRFSFTLDATDNNYLGWIIDDVMVGWPAGDGSSTTTTVPYHDKWDQALFEWDLDGGAFDADNSDKSTASFSIPEAQLGNYGLATPGDHTLTMRVTDSVGLDTQNSVVLHVLDGIAPTASLLIPNGGDSWAYSPDTVNRQKHLVVWNALDNFPPMARTKLSYSTNGTTYTCIADSSGTSCGNNGLTAAATSYLWSMPTQAEAAAAGQTFPTATARLKVEVWDGSNNTASDTSDANVYIIQPTTSAIKTLILWNTARIAAQYGTPARDSLSNKLIELADHNKINGFILDLNNAGLPYAAWDADPTNQTKANAVATALRNYLLNQLNTYSAAQYLILVGDDTQIPHYRMVDGTTFYTEANYPAQVGLNTGTTVGSAINQGFLLTDNYYSELAPEATGLPAPHDLSYLNDLYIGRLVETPTQIEGLVNTYLEQDGQVNVTGASDRILIAGHDFLYDSAKSIKDGYVNPPASKPTDFLLDDPDAGGDEYSPAALQAQLLSATAHRVINLNDHANHFSFSTSTGSLSATTLDGSATEMRGSVLYSPGCHSGLNVPSSDSHALDLPELMSKKKVAGYIANTGYGWGLRYGTGLSEKLMELISDEILENGSIAIGKAMGDAKRRYHILERRYDVFDEKVEHELTLYGIPNYLVVTSLSFNGKPEAELPKPNGPDSGCAGGICLKKSLVADSLPIGVTELNLSFDFSSAYQMQATVDGTYYTLNGQSSGETGEPIQPHFAYDSALSGTKAHGVIFTGGAYQVFSPFNSVIAVPRSTNTDGGEGPIPVRRSITPDIRVSSADSGQPSSTPPLTNMVVHTGIYDNNTEKRFDTMQFAVYYSDEVANQDVDPPAVTDPGLGGFHTVSGNTASFAVQVSDASGVYRVLVTYDELANSEWKTLDLTYNATATKWEGSLTLAGDILYFVQAVDMNGNVGMLSESGADVDGNGQPYGSTWIGSKVFVITAGGGSYLFFDDFEDNDVSDWTPTKGTWTAGGGAMHGTFDKKGDTIANGFPAGCTTCTIEADLQADTPGARVSLLGWYTDKKNYVEVRLMEDSNKVLFKQYTTAGTAAKKAVPFAINPATSYHVKVSYSGGTYDVSIDGAPIITITTPAVPAGTVGFRIKSTTGAAATGTFGGIIVY